MHGLERFLSLSVVKRKQSNIAAKKSMICKSMTPHIGKNTFQDSMFRPSKVTVVDYFGGMQKNVQFGTVYRVIFYVNFLMTSPYCIVLCSFSWEMTTISVLVHLSAQ